MHQHATDDLPLSILAQSALVRLAMSVAILAVLWLAVWWAVSLS